MAISTIKPAPAVRKAAGKRPAKAKPVAARLAGPLGQALIDALLVDFKEGGAPVVAKLRKNRPYAYLELITSLLPREAAEEASQEAVERTESRISEIRQVIVAP